MHGLVFGHVHGKVSLEFHLVPDTTNMEVELLAKLLIFMEYLSTTRLFWYHKKSPWVQIPLEFTRFGLKSIVACLSLEKSLQPNFDFVETNILSKRKLISVLSETIKMYKLFFRYKPNIFLQVNVRSPLFPVIIYRRILSAVYKSAFPTLFILKLDWDGEGDNVSKIAFITRKLLISIYSLFFDIIIAESSCAAYRLRKFLLFDYKKLRIIPNGYPDDIIAAHKTSRIDREDLILCAARFNRIKGQFLLITAFYNISKDFPSWKLVLVGQDEDAKYIDELRRIVADYGMQDRISLFTNISDEVLYNYYFKSKIFCLPSYKEGFANVRIEAIAAGLPVLTSDAGCGLDIDPSGEYVFKRGDLFDLQKKLTKLLKSEIDRNELHLRQKGILLSYKDIVKLLSKEYCNKYPGN